MKAQGIQGVIVEKGVEAAIALLASLLDVAIKELHEYIESQQSLQVTAGDKAKEEK